MNQETDANCNDAQRLLTASNGSHCNLLSAENDVEIYKTIVKTSVPIKSPKNNENNIALTKPIKRKGADAWLYLLHLIKTKKLAAQMKKNILTFPKEKIVVNECYLTPRQTAVVHEVDPIFGTVEAGPSFFDLSKISAAAAAAIFPHSKIFSLESSLEALNMLSPAATATPKRYATSPTTTTTSGTTKLKRNKNQKSKTTTAKSSTATTSGTTLRLRQTELHRLQLKVEQRRIQLLDLKISREQEEAVRAQILFQKDLELKSLQMNHFSEHF